MAIERQLNGSNSTGGQLNGRPYLISACPEHGDDFAGSTCDRGPPLRACRRRCLSDPRPAPSPRDSRASASRAQQVAGRPNFGSNFALLTTRSCSPSSLTDFGDFLPL